jgi:uncharacterized protein with NRDE domain
MCTIIALSGVHPGYPLIVAANRDEFTSRRATGPVLLSEAPRVLGGRDQQGKGTWLGATARGFFVGLTNQRTWTVPDGSRTSRGGLVLDALRLGGVDAVEAHLRAIAPRTHNPYNLMFGDAAGIAVAYVRDESPAVTVHRLAPGMHVLANDRIGSPWFPKQALAPARVPVEAVPAMDLDAVFAALRPVLMDHSIPEGIPAPPAGSLMPAALARQLQAMCVHTPGYGTVSATMLAVTTDGVARYLFADGPPCTAPFVEHAALLRDGPARDPR